jgi:hypothetical protein
MKLAQNPQKSAQEEMFFKKIDSQRAFCCDFSTQISLSTKDSEDTKKQVHESHAVFMVVL